MTARFAWLLAVLVSFALAPSTASAAIYDIPLDVQSGNATYYPGGVLYSYGVEQYGTILPESTGILDFTSVIGGAKILQEWISIGDATTTYGVDVFVSFSGSNDEKIVFTNATGQDVNYDADFTLGAGSIAAVPLPDSIYFFGLGLAVLSGYYWLRRQKNA